MHNRAINSTNNPNDFYEYQIKSGGKEIQNSYKDFCKGMGIEVSESADVEKSIDFLRRTSFKQMSEYITRKHITGNKLLFCHR